MKLFKLGPKKGVPGLNIVYGLAGLAILGIVVISITAVFWIGSFNQELRQDLVDLKISQAQRAAGEIEGVINREIRKSETLAYHLAWVGRKSEVSGSLIYPYLSEDLREISIIDLEGQEEKGYSKQKYYTLRELRDWSGLEQFEKAKRGQTYVSEVKFTADDEPYLIITTPIRKVKFEEPRAVLRVQLYLARIWSPILQWELGKATHISVVDDQGMLIADPDPARVLRKVDLSSLPSVQTVTEGEIFEGDYYLNKKGVSVMGVGIPIEATGWGVIIQEKASEFEAPIKEIRANSFLFLATGAGAVIILILSVLKLRRTERALVQKTQTLMAKTKQLEEMRTVLEIKVKARTRELEELAERREQIIKERTKELQDRVKELERFHRLTVGRELKMVELKKKLRKANQKIKELEADQRG